jgi:hypothetical protein
MADTKAARGAELALKPELDLEDARRRLAEAAEDAKRLEDAGAGWQANEAWKRHLLIKGALEAQERKEHAARKLAGSE